MIKFRFTVKTQGNKPCLSICEEQTPAQAMDRLVVAGFSCGTSVTKVSETLLVLRTLYMGRDEIDVFQGPAEEMEKLVALATLYPQARDAYEKTEEHIEGVADAVRGVISLIAKGVPKEIALCMPPGNSENGGRIVLKKAVLHVFDASEEEMRMCLELEEMKYKEILFLGEMIEEGIFSSFTEALAYAKAS